MAAEAESRRGTRRDSTEVSNSAVDGTAEAIDEALDPAADPESVARSIALNLLTAAPRTRAQLAEAMAKRQVPDEVAVRILDRFEEVGLIDDAAFAAAWVSSRQAGRGLAPRALANELRKKGVAEPVISDAVAMVDRDTVESTARALARRKARASVGLPTEARMRRLAGMLARKGYASDIALRVVKDVLAEENVDVTGEFGREIADYIAADS